MNRKRHERAGRWAETLALISLMCRGYWPRACRYKTPVGEIDLVMQRGKTLVFVEVKGRKTYADAAYAVHTTNQARVVRAAQQYLAAHPSLQHLAVRFDVCLVAWYRLPQHITNAFAAT